VRGTLPFTGFDLRLVLELAAGLLGAGLVLVLGGRPSRRPAFAGLQGVREGSSPAPHERPHGYRIVIPGVGGFATVADADRYFEEQAQARRRAGYRTVAPELGTSASTRDEPAGE
jgi:hypothetical protein